MARREALERKQYGQGMHRSASFAVTPGAVEVQAIVSRDGWPNTSNPVMSIRNQISRDGGTTWENYGGAIGVPGRSFDINGNPVTEFRVVGRVARRNAQTGAVEYLTLGAGILSRIEIEVLTPITTRVEQDTPTRPTPAPGVLLR